MTFMNKSGNTKFFFIIYNICLLSAHNSYTVNQATQKYLRVWFHSGGLCSKSAQHRSYRTDTTFESVNYREYNRRANHAGKMCGQLLVPISHLVQYGNVALAMSSFERGKKQEVLQTSYSIPGNDMGKYFSVNIYFSSYWSYVLGFSTIHQKL